MTVQKPPTLLKKRKEKEKREKEREKKNSSQGLYLCPLSVLEAKYGRPIGTEYIVRGRRQVFHATVVTSFY